MSFSQLRHGLWTRDLLTIYMYIFFPLHSLPVLSLHLAIPLCHGALLVC